MTTHVLDGQATRTSLDGLHQAAEAVASERLPCRVHDPDLWFADVPADVESAKALCVDCPVRELCLHGALERQEPWGVWGGELFLAGAVIARKRPRGRPRKSDSPPEPDPRHTDLQRTHS